VKKQSRLHPSASDSRVTRMMLDPCELLISSPWEIQHARVVGFLPARKESGLGLEREFGMVREEKVAPVVMIVACFGKSS
jgi:hypothetical protein